MEREQVSELVDRVLANQPTDLGPTRLIKHRIQLTSDKPVRHKPRRMASGFLEATHRIVNKWKLDDIIELSDSDYSSAPVMVRKLDDTYCMCIDSRDVNARTVRQCTCGAWCLSCVGAVLNGLRGARYISKINPKAVFLLVPMEERSKRYTAFGFTESDLWQFKRMPFGLRNSPATCSSRFPVWSWVLSSRV